MLEKTLKDETNKPKINPMKIHLHHLKITIPNESVCTFRNIYTYDVTMKLNTVANVEFENII